MARDESGILSGQQDSWLDLCGTNSKWIWCLVTCKDLLEESMVCDMSSASEHVLTFWSQSRFKGTKPLVDQ